MSDASELPLFVFGTLMDPDVFEAVTGRTMSTYVTRPARLPGMSRRVASGEPYPVLVVDARDAVDGILIESLRGDALARARFFEGEEFELEQTRVELVAEDRTIDACFFADRTDHEHGDGHWRLADWQRDTKSGVMARIRRYMDCFGRMGVAEADAYW